MRAWASGSRTAQRTATPSRPTGVDHFARRSAPAIGNQAALRRLIARAEARAPVTTKLRRQPAAQKTEPKSAGCPDIEPGELAASKTTGLKLVERIPQQEWLVYGFPIGGGETPAAEAGEFIQEIVRSLQRGHMIYMTGQDPLEVMGYSDCLSGPGVDNQQIRKHRAESFCAGARAHFAASPKSASSLINACGPAPADQYFGPNATREDRQRNRGLVIRKNTQPTRYQEGEKTFPFDPKYKPSEANCAAYASDPVRNLFGPTYPKNAHCSCQVTPDEPHNNCVRSCLQDKMWTLVANESPKRKPGDPPMDIDLACPAIWRHHRECYHDCGCDHEFIDYLAFDAVCNIPLPCAVDSAAINLLNRCMPATPQDK